MEISMSALWRMITFAFLLGIGFGVLYDVFRITRVMAGVEYAGIGKKSTDRLYSIKYPFIGKLEKKEGKIRKRFLHLFVGIGDIIFCLIIGVAFSIFLYYSNDGIFRWQAAAAGFLGFFLYYRTLGTLVIYFAEIICIFLKIIIKILLYAIAFPFRIMYNILVKVSKAVLGVPVAWILKKIRLKNTEHTLKTLLATSSSGFIEKYLKGQGG
ncbi:MAG: hypothetical protein E7671_05950 [Ruminococcaceae bacterium]|nr:hypothetical protein [Oscillospiraceae bacterium]